MSIDPLLPFNPGQYWEERLRQHWGLQGAGRLRFGDAYNRWAYRIQRHVFLRTLRRTGFDFRQARVLDIGTGVGFYVDRWRELGAARITGVDITKVATEAMRRKYPDQEFYQLDISGDPDPLAGHTFDGISAIAVLFHIVDDARYAQALRNIFGLLRRGGLFIFSEGLLHHPAARAAHVVYRPLQEIEGLLAATGFQSVARVPLHFFMSYPDDTGSRLAQRLSQVLGMILSLHNSCGFLIGAGLYPIERLAVSLAHESPTIELMVCRKP